MNKYNVWQMSCGCFGSPVVRQSILFTVDATTTAEAEVKARQQASPGTRLEVELITVKV